MDIVNTIIIGMAIASIWFWVAVLLKVTSPQRGFGDWLKYTVPQGIIIAWAIKILELLKW
jgi:hypothetical protein